MTPEDLRKLMDLREAAPNYIDIVYRNRFDQAAEECEDFYEAAHAILPDLVKELESLRGFVRRIADDVVEQVDLLDPSEVPDCPEGGDSCVEHWLKKNGY